MLAGFGWDALLAEFRVLGGTADNVILRQGPRGRGLFPVDPAAPVRLRLPPNLFVRADDTEVRDGRLVLKASATIGPRERAFFNNYQQAFSWGAGVFDDLWQTQLAWSRLPREVQQILPVRAARFSAPSEDLCRERYTQTRGIMYRDTHLLMPILELVNHRSEAPRFETTDNGIAVGGLFEDEVLVDYGSADCWGMAVNHGFRAPRSHAYSLAGSFKFEDYRIEIRRTFDRVKRCNGRVLPTAFVEGDTIRFPFLTLGNVKLPHMPRAVFIHIAKDMPITQPNSLFDLIQHYNRLLLLRFLHGTEGLATPLVTLLRSAAYHQLETLSSYWGTAPVTADTANS